MPEKLTKEYVEARIANLKRNPVANANLIKKWERKRRKIQDK